MPNLASLEVCDVWVFVARSVSGSEIGASTYGLGLCSPCPQRTMNHLYRTNQPTKTLIALALLFSLTVAVFIGAIGNLQSALTFTGKQRTSITLTEFQAQIEVLEVVVSEHEPTARLRHELEVLQAKALQVRNETRDETMAPDSREALNQALNRIEALRLERLLGANQSELEQISAEVHSGFRGVLEGINRTRNHLLATLQILTISLCALMLLLALTVLLAVWQYARALRIAAARTLQAEGDRTALEQVATALRQTETVLQRERDFGVLVLNTMGQGLSVTNEAGAFEYVNPAYARLLGMNPEDLIGRSPFELVSNEDHAAMAQGRNDRQAGRITMREHHLRRHDGTSVPTLVTGVPRFENGLMTGTIAVLTDLTESKRNETRLHELYEIASAHALEPERRIKALLRLGMEAFALETGLLAQVHRDARHALEDDLNVMPFGEPPRIKLEVAHWLAQDGSDVGELELELARVAIRAARPVLGRDHIAVPIQVQGCLYGCLSFSRRSGACDHETAFNRYDEEFLKLIGQWLGHELERVESEGQLRERTEQLNAVIKVSPDGFLIMNHEGYITDVNPALLEMTGLEREALVGATDVHFDIILQWLADPNERFSSAREASEQQPDILQIVRPNPRILKRTTRAIRDADGLEVGRVMYFRDVTHETEVSRMKSEFLSTVAHELRTPMASIYGFSELLLQRNFDETVRLDLTETIHRQAGRLVKLLNELLDLARIEARAGKDFQIFEHDLEPLLQSTLEVFVPVDQRHRLELDLPPVPAVPLDGEKFRQALGNVISNAFKFADHGPVKVGFVTDSTKAARVGVRVQDHGIGMLPHESSRAFERFFRADTSGKTPGTGLGLSLVKEIVELHGGTVELESELGCGTSVTLWFPRSRPQPFSTSPPHPNPSRTTRPLETSNR
jgi:PAS domain S-box-containing protein